jgi:hypothetical protein
MEVWSSFGMKCGAGPPFGVPRDRGMEGGLTWASFGGGCRALTLGQRSSPQGLLFVTICVTFTARQSVIACFGKCHMRMHLPPFGSALPFLLAFVCCAVARPATTKDLAGRTVCWDNGETSAFLPGGKYVNSRHGSGDWKVTSAGLEIHSDTLGGIFRVEIQEDGTILDANYNIAGKFCK